MEMIEVPMRHVSLLWGKGPAGSTVEKKFISIAEVKHSQKVEPMAC